MPTISFEGDTHDDIVAQVRRWLATAEEEVTPSPASVINQSADITKDALRVIAESAPSEVASNELFKALTTMGYKVTDQTREAALTGLDAIEAATGGGVVKNVADRGAKALFEMNAQVAKQVLKAMVAD